MIVHDVEQRTPEWFKVRAGKPSSSRFSSLITGTGRPSDGLDDYALELAAEKVTGMPIDDGFQGNRFTKRGEILEEHSAAWYEMEYQAPIKPVGFITDDLMRWGTSTDGLIGDNGLVEFKNLIAKEFIKLLVYMARNKGKAPSGYIPQVQGELMIAEREWCDLVFYHPQFKPIVIRHYPNEKFQSTLREQLVAVCARRDHFAKLAGEYQ